MIASGAAAGIDGRRIIVAPMGGGPSTPELVIAAAGAGALAFVAGAYLSADELGSVVREVRDRGGEPFGINIFVPGAPTVAPDEVARYADELRPEGERLGVDLGTPTWDDDGWDAKIELLFDVAPAVCSFTFGCPPSDIIQSLRRRGSVVVVTVTNEAEADVAVGAGAEVLCAQGIEAGAHRGAFTDDDRDDEGLSTLELVAALRARHDRPIIATGGIATPVDVSAALAAGASAIQAGTAFLRCDESGASALHKNALIDGRFAKTAVTRAFTGRRARGLENRFMRKHSTAPLAYPEVHHLTRPLRAAAVAHADAETTNLWAGTRHHLARTGPAAAIVDWLSSALE